MNGGGVTAPAQDDASGQGGPEAAATAAADLVTSLMLRPWGQVSLSVYETGRLVTLAPWLTGHLERIGYLVAAQRHDGSWGAPDGYALVPTLSATEAVLAAFLRDDPGADVPALRRVAERGLAVLAEWLRVKPELPDMPAIEHIVPSLVGRLNEHVLHLPGLAPLPLPSGLADGVLDRIRSWVASGAELPEKLVHALEIAGAAAAGARGVRPTAIGTIGASPAATAAWLGERGALDAHDPARGHLEAVARRHGGPVPVGLPITVFERSWVLSWLARTGVPFDTPPEMLADLRASIGPAGTPAGPGLPADADTTAVALYALALLGSPCEPESLWAFHRGTHFATWPDEDGASVSVNAHVLDAFGRYVACRPEAAARYGPASAQVAAWLRERQAPDGSWSDRWHASPYYATVSCALALDEFGGEASARAVRAAAGWVLDTQRPDGSWGRWQGTAEETAYAIQTLVMTRGSEDPRRGHAVRRGLAYLAHAQAEDPPPLWHDKDLYTPIAVVRAALIATWHVARRT